MGEATQTLAVGEVRDGRYPSLGGVVGPAIAPLDQQFLMIVGASDSGKSCLVHSHPEAYVINTDLSSVSTPTPKATVWPDPRAPEALSQEGVLRKIHLLEGLAQRREPRPKVVVFDSITTLIPLFQDAIARKFSREGQTRSFLDIGQAGWVTLANDLITLVERLRAAGYGVIVIAHLTKKYIALDENKHVSDTRLLMPPSAFTQLYPRAELVVAIAKQRVTRIREVEQPPVKKADGSEIILKPKKVPEETMIHVVDFNNPDLDNIVRGRVPKENFELPLRDGWAAFDAWYKEQSAIRMKGDG